MAKCAIQSTFGSSASVAIHDHGDVLGNSIHVQKFFHISFLIIFLFLFLMTGLALFPEVVGHRHLEGVVAIGVLK